MIALMLFCLALASASGVAVSLTLHLGFWIYGVGFESARQLLAGGLGVLVLFTAGLMFVHTKAEGSRMTFERLLRGAPRWVQPTLLSVWAYTVWIGVMAANELLGISDPELLLLASVGFLGIYSTLFAINSAAFMRHVGRWEDS